MTDISQLLKQCPVRDKRNFFFLLLYNPPTRLQTVSVHSSASYRINPATQKGSKMAFYKISCGLFLTLLCIGYSQSAVLFGGARVVAPLAAAVPVAHALDTQYDPLPQYSYAYKVQDALTGDNKSQQETRDGDVVTGSYSVQDPDGTFRTVTYTADPINGFNAVVQRTPIVQRAAVVPALAPAVVPARYFG